MLKEKEIEAMKILIKNNNAAKFGLDEDYENLGSLNVEDYLESLLEDEESDVDAKKMIFKFTNKYIHKNLYAVKGVLNDVLYILIENEDDEIIDRLRIGEFKVEETWDDYSILTMPMRIEDHLRLYAILDEELEDNDKLEMFNQVGKYLGLDKYICSAKDNDLFESTIMLISDKDGNIIEKINY
ncbi:hypothetical protein [Clostridium uliginosum]|uniref:Uncharacterized protein n=1 Tax=Clostridium uliginosum TaxID=119641 RepID=A0A1I1GRV7_9CLOT|nr:hypothetical protein [Clostridium uliginosum]SFC14549.1 hypothetical protein SAMN05421842_10147 [Clostridium uliginosum]